MPFSTSWVLLATIDHTGATGIKGPPFPNMQAAWHLDSYWGWAIHSLPFVCRTKPLKNGICSPRSNSISIDSKESLSCPSFPSHFFLPLFPTLLSFTFSGQSHFYLYIPFDNNNNNHSNYNKNPSLMSNNRQRKQAKKATTEPLSELEKAIRAIDLATESASAAKERKPCYCLGKRINNASCQKAAEKSWTAV